MVDEICREAISTLVDGEAQPSDAEASVERLGGDEAARRCWQRYHLIGEVMRGNRHAVLDASFADRVSEALRSEPTVLAPAPRARLRPWMGYGLAAGIAALAAVLVWPVAQQPAEVAMGGPAAGRTGVETQLAGAAEPQPQRAEPLGTVTNDAGANGGAANGEDASVRLARYLAQSAANQDPGAPAGVVFGPRPTRLEPYLVNHSEYLGAEVRGLMPYARLISHDVARR